MKQVRAILMHNYAVLVTVVITVAANVISLFKHQHAFTALIGQALGHYRAGKPGSNHNRIIFHG